MAQVTPEMKEAVAGLIEKIGKDFEEKMDLDFTQFRNSISYSMGRKYLKITLRNGARVWGFVVNDPNDKKFNYGDILRPASFAAPMRNHARGNVFTGYDVTWGGPAYMGTVSMERNNLLQKMYAASQDMLD